MAFSIRFGTLTLDGCSDFAITANSRVSEYRFPRRPGSLAPRVPVADSKHVVIGGDIWKGTESEIVNYLDSLNQTLSDKGRDKLYLRDNNRFLYAVKSGFSHQFVYAEVPSTHAKFSIEFVVDDPYWYSATPESDSQTVGAVNSKTWAITNDGKARTPPVIELTRTSAANDQSDVLITNTTTGLYLKWAGTFVNGSKLIFDTVNKRVTSAGGNGLNNFTGTLNFMLESGANNLRYDGPGNATILTTWQERYS